MEIVDILARCIGAFYALAGALGIRAVLMDHVLDQALSGLTLAPVAPAEAARRRAVAAICILSAGAGLALALLSPLSVPLLLAGLMVQLVYYGLGESPEARDDPEARADRRRNFNATIGYVVLAGLAAWLVGFGRMGSWTDPWALGLIGALVLVLWGYFVWHTRWKAPRFSGLSDFEGEAEALREPPDPARVLIRAGMGEGPLWDLDTSEPVDPFDHLPVEIAARLEIWNAAHSAAPEAGPAHRAEAAELAAALEGVFGKGNVVLAPEHDLSSDAPPPGSPAR